MYNSWTMITLAYAETPSTQQPSSPSTPPFFNFVPIIGMLVIFYFFMIRPQQKRAKEHKKMLDAIQKGDLVVTSGGIYGTVSSVGDKTIDLKVAENVKIKISRSAVTDKLNSPEAANGKPSVQLEIK